MEYYMERYNILSHMVTDLENLSHVVNLPIPVKGLFNASHFKFEDSRC